MSEKDKKRWVNGHFHTHTHPAMGRVMEKLANDMNLEGNELKILYVHESSIVGMEINISFLVLTDKIDELRECFRQCFLECVK